MSNLRERYHKENNSTLKTRFLLENEEILREAPDPSGLADTLVAGRQQFKKIQQLLAAIPGEKLGTLKSAVAKANAAITNPKFTNSCMALLASLESLFGYMGKILQTFDEAKEQPDQSIRVAMNTGSGTQTGDSVATKAAQKIISQSLTPNGKFSNWLSNKLGKSFITGAQADQIANEFMELTYTEFTALQTKSRDIAAAKVGMNAAQEAGKTKPEATPDGQAAGAATAGSSPAVPAGGTAPGAAPAATPTPQNAVEVLEKAGINLKGMSDEDKRKFFEEVVKASAAA